MLIMLVITKKMLKLNLHVRFEGAFLQLISLPKYEICGQGKLIETTPKKSNIHGMLIGVSHRNLIDIYGVNTYFGC